MLKTFISLCVAVSVLFGADTDGFRDFKWGDSPTKDMKVIEKEKTTNTIAYYRSKDKMSIGSAKISSILYYFFDKKFYSTFVTFEGLSNFTAIKSTLESKHGTGYQPNEFIDTFYWFGGNSTIALSYHEIGDKGSILISNKELEDKRKEYENNLASKGVSDL